MADRRVKNVIYGTTVFIKATFNEHENGENSEPDSFTVVVKKGSTTVDTWVAGVDSEIVSVESEGVFQYYQIQVDTTIFTEPCEASVTMSGTFNTTPAQTIVGKARLIITN
jgi:hypothetical protein